MPNPKDAEEEDLENLVFGGEDGGHASAIFSKIGQEAGGLAPNTFASKHSDSEEDEDEDEDEDDDREEDEEDEEDEQEDAGDSLFFVDTAANAWVDDDMEDVTVALKTSAKTRRVRTDIKETHVSGDVYEERLREQFQKVNPVPKWAAEAEASAWDDEDEPADPSRISSELLKSTKSLVSKASALLPSTTINITPLRNANQAAPSQSVVSCVQFHPTASVVMTAGLDKTLRLFEVDGKENHKIQSVYFKDLPIRSAQFIRQGQEIVVSGRRGFYYSVDVERAAVTRIAGITGHKIPSLERMFGSPNSDRLAFMSNGGQIHLVSARTKQFMHTLPMNGVVRDLAFTNDGQYLWSVGLDNEVYQWDLRQNRCLSRWHDPTSFRPACLGLSPDNSYYACGDNSGIVNLYEAGAMLNNLAQATSRAFSINPFKSIDNLTTPINGVKFNHNSELMGFYSARKSGQFKLVHLPSATVFANWPTASTPLGTVESFDFSPHSGFLAIGSSSGKALLYRLTHYNTY
ncbi:WD40 repeat-like protein [Linderina pennispora]|uniref:WD40 repeat-like protein n=1 Tax=Linderina pennispora TaxID=61395 RepID=A0A1Y1WK83_9FUNG|nr:WD40 repeat-like protein [Linderina pennispora]ORX73981.1 WD40 repeat-like protein [Linderina pennispora]